MNIKLKNLGLTNITNSFGLELANAFTNLSHLTELRMSNYFTNQTKEILIEKKNIYLINCILFEM